MLAIFERSFDNAVFSRPARHEHCPCYVRPFAAGINFVEPAFARSEIKVNLYLACLIAVLSNPADFVASLARHDKNVYCLMCRDGESRILYFTVKSRKTHFILLAIELYLPTTIKGKAPEYTQITFRHNLNMLRQKGIFAHSNESSMNTVWIVMPILIVLMFLLGISLNKKAFTDVARNPRAVLLGMFGQIIILPLLAFIVAWVLKLPPVYFMGLVLVACCPGGSSSNVFSMLAKGDVALSVTLTALSSVITLFTLPFIMEFVSNAVSGISGVEIELPVGKLLIQNLVLIFAPMFIGTLFRHYFPSGALKVSMVLGKIAFPALIVLALIFFLQYKAEIAEHFTVLGLSAALLISAAMLCSSWLSRFGNLSSSSRRTIVIEVGMQNAAQAIAIASSPFVFNSGEMALPAIMYALLMNVILLIYVYCCIIRK